MSWLYAIIVFIFDRITKFWALSNLLGQGTKEGIPGLFQLVFVSNKGVAFGMLGEGRYLQSLIGVVGLALLIWLLYSYTFSPLQRWALVTLIVGAAGNLVDRLFYGYVIDMIQLSFISFPVFNVADICVVFGVIIMMGSLLFSSKPLEKRKVKNSESER